MTVHDAYRQLTVYLQSIYEKREANSIAGIVIGYLTGYTNSDRIVHRQEVFTQDQQQRYHLIVLDLMSGRPMQYVLQEAHWRGMNLYADESVLIPRPETEELVDWITEDVRYKTPDIRCDILDIGTGSGCIAIGLKKELPLATLHATDVSADALQVAKINSAEQGTNIHFYEADILNQEQWKIFPQFHIIVSNPPYIMQNEAMQMHDNVLKFEPHLALFVPDNEPLLFYESISDFGLQHLLPGGRLFFEINEVFGDEVTELLMKKGYRNIGLKKDMQGKNRMIKAEAPNP